MTNKKRRRGFTIVELAVVIAVMGILASATVYTYTGVTQRARKNTAETQAQCAVTALLPDMGLHYYDTDLVVFTVQGSDIYAFGFSHGGKSVRECALCLIATRDEESYPTLSAQTDAILEALLTASPLEEEESEADTAWLLLNDDIVLLEYDEEGELIENENYDETDWRLPENTALLLREAGLSAEETVVYATCLLRTGFFGESGFVYATEDEEPNENSTYLLYYNDSLYTGSYPLSPEAKDVAPWGDYVEGVLVEG